MTKSPNLESNTEKVLDTPNINQLIAANYGYLLKLANKLLKGSSINSVDAEDLVQMVAMRIFKKQHQYQPETNFRAWASKILYNQFFTLYRAGTRNPLIFVDDDFNTAAEDCDPTHEPGFNEIEPEILKALEEINPAQREVLLLRANGLDYNEIATQVGCAIGTVMSRLSRAREKMQNALGDNHPLLRSDPLP